MTTLLVADRDAASLGATVALLADQGYTLHWTSSGNDVPRLVGDIRPDLVLLDPMLPGPMDGWEVCRQLRQQSDTPIVMLTAATDDVDRVIGLDLGADDYITKPYNPRELLARVRAVLRRSHGSQPHGSELTVGDLRIDPTRYEVTIRGEPVTLALKEFSLLTVLARYPDRVIPRARLLQLVWPADRSSSSHALDVHMCWLRHKLGNSSARIERVRGVGYRLIDSHAA
jgi:DNA-binding response OmpR family regulator